MAKRKEQTTPSDQASQGSATSSMDTVETSVVAFAEQLGRVVGAVQAKADGWLDSKTLKEQLTRIRDEAADLLSHIGSETASTSGAAAPAQKPTASKKPGRSAGATAAWRTASATGRSGGKVDAPGKTHRKAPAAGRSIKHSNEMVPKLKAAEARRRTRRG
jgi:hypothetical protein